MLVTREQCSTVVTVTIIVLHTHSRAEADHLPQLPPTSPETDEGVTSKYRGTHLILLLCNNINYEISAHSGVSIIILIVEVCMWVHITSFSVNS